MPAPVAISWEAPVTQFWPPGFASHKQTTTVRHKQQAICLDGHDCGRFIPHLQLTPAPNNLRQPLILFSSSRKNNFKAPGVKMNGTAVGTFIMLNWPPMPMTSCAEPVAYPFACSTTSLFNSVEVGMSLATYLISFLTLAANVLVDRWLWKREQMGAKKSEVALLGSLLTVQDTSALALKSVVATASSVASLAFTNDEGSFPLIAGAPFGLEISRTADGMYGVKASVKRKIGRDGKGAFGQSRSTEVSASISVAGSAGGKFEAKGDVKAKDSSGYQASAQVKRSSDPEHGKSGLSGEISGQNPIGNKATVKAEGSSDSRAHRHTEKDSLAFEGGMGSSQQSRSQTRDDSFRLLREDETSTVSAPGQGTRITETQTTYPTEPNLGEPPSVTHTSRML